MQSTSLLIAIAAFAVTTTGVQAYGGSESLHKAGLDDRQVSAIMVAGNLQALGDIVAARDVLVIAGITDETLLQIHRAKRQADQAAHRNDFTSFTRAQHDAYQFARQHNKRAVMQAVLDEVGL